jgi:hypothetical protein
VIFDGAPPSRAVQCDSGSNELSRLVARCDTLGLLAAGSMGLT